MKKEFIYLLCWDDNTTFLAATVNSRLKELQTKWGNMLYNVVTQYHGVNHGGDVGVLFYCSITAEIHIP